LCARNLENIKNTKMGAAGVTIGLIFEYHE
jgi:hypothetical protein